MKKLVFVLVFLLLSACNSKNSSGSKGGGENHPITPASQEQLALESYKQQSIALIDQYRHRIDRVVGPYSADNILNRLASIQAQYDYNTNINFPYNRGVNARAGLLTINPQLFNQANNQQNYGQRRERIQRLRHMSELLELIGINDIQFQYSRQILNTRWR